MRRESEGGLREWRPTMARCLDQLYLAVIRDGVEAWPLLNLSQQLNFIESTIKHKKTHTVQSNTNNRKLQ